MNTLKYVFDRLGLSVNERKTYTANAYESGFDFLGFEFRMRKSLRTGRYYPNTQPSHKSVAKIKKRITYLTSRNLTPVPREEVIKNVNLSLRGWVNYFHYGNSSQAFGKVK